MIAAAPEARTAEWAFYPTQKAFFLDEAKYSCFLAGRRSGKTIAGARKAIAKVRNGGFGIIAGPSFPSVRIGAKRAFLTELDALEISWFENKNEAIVVIPRYDATVQLAGLENDTYTRGPNYAWGWVDELDMVSDEERWKELKGAVRDGDHPQLFATSTPKGRRLIWREWIRDAAPDHTFHRASSLHNPFGDAAGYVASLGYAGRFYEQEVDAAFVSFEGLVYPGFNRETAVHAVECAGWRSVLGVDAGTRNPTAILTIRSAGDGRRHIEREFYERGLSSRALVEAVEAEAEATGADTIYVDPSAAGLIADLVMDGYHAVKANNAVSDGIRAVTTAIDEGLTVDPSCIHTISELEQYHYQEGGKAAEASDKPVKAEDHAVDAARYSLVGETEPVMEVNIW